MKLVYYSHRYRNVNLVHQLDNLYRSIHRFGALQDQDDEHMFAPWIDLAVSNSNKSEQEAWEFIHAALKISDEILIDLDGEPMSEGMEKEKEIMESQGKKIRFLT